MSPHRERVIHGTVVSEHLVQLFDESESLIAGVSTFLFDAWKRGDHLLVIARASNWAMTAPELEAQGCPVPALIAEGRLIVLDAATTLAAFMVNGDPDPVKFQASVGDLVTRVCAESPHGVAAYGEMVDILAAQGNFRAAEQLEGLWNELSQACSFRLLCGYTAAHFGDERTASSLQAICAAHTHASARPLDLLSTWLLANRRPKYHLDTQ
jgi:hypothetical protein